MSAACMARYVAKNLVKAELGEKHGIQVAHAIGVSEPVAIYVNSFGTSKLNDEKLEKLIAEYFDFSPAGVIKKLNFFQLIYKETASFGYFGRKGKGFSWETTDGAEILADIAS